MKGKREAVWAVVITATLITAGLILSCGDDDGDGNGEVTCEGACEKLEDCELIPGDYGEDVEECVEFCEDTDWQEAEIGCFIDISCDDLGIVCMWCGTACGVVNYCELEDLPGGVDDLDKCYEECKKEDDGVMFDYVECVLEAMILTCDDVEDCFN